MMLPSNKRRDMYSDCRTTMNTSTFVTTPLSALSSTTRTSTKSQHTSYRYTIVKLLSLRPPNDITIFPDHLIERRFLDEESYVDLDRMLLEKAGQFQTDKTLHTSDTSIVPSRIYKYDFSDPIVIEKVKNRRPKDPLTPQQVAALTSVTTRYQTTLSSSYSDQIQTPHVWIDDYSHQNSQPNTIRQYFPPEPSMPYQRQNPNQCDLYVNQVKTSLLPTYNPAENENQTDENVNQTSSIPILQRLFEAERLQQYEQGLSAFCTPITPQKPRSMVKNQNDTLTELINQHLKCSITMETPATPNVFNNNKLNYVSTPSSPTEQQDNSPSLADKISTNKSSYSKPQSLENWFGTSIYKNSYPRMPSDHVLAACDLEQ